MPFFYIKTPKKLHSLIKVPTHDSFKSTDRKRERGNREIAKEPIHGVSSFNVIRVFRFTFLSPSLVVSPRNVCEEIEQKS